jgi:hypothetical protein
LSLLLITTDQALCKGADISLWFPDFETEEGEQVFDDGTVFESYGDTTDFYEAARSICSVCPMKDPCLEYAMEHRIRFGMYGGMTPIERRRVERRDRRKRLQERRRTEAAATLDEPDLDFDDTVDS